MSTNKETEILSMLTEAYPDLDVGPGTPFYEMVVRPMAFLWSKHAAGQDELVSANVLENYATMNPDDLDRLITRFFETRKTGDYVHIDVRLVFDTLRDYYIPKGLSLTMDNTRSYTTINDYYASSLELMGDAANGYYLDVTAISSGKGNAFNAYMNEAVSLSDTTLAVYLNKAYILKDSTDGGIVESNVQTYARIKSGMTLKNLTTYRGVKGTLTKNFNVKEVVPIGLRDSEMRRDLVELPGAGVVHRGGMSDIYIRVEPYSIIKGYEQPLGFPYTFNGISIETDPNGLMAEWNKQDFGDIDIFDRGSIKETIPGLSPQTSMSSLTSNIRPMHDFATSTEEEALHSNNLVKQMWPLVVRGKIRVSDPLGASIASVARSAFVQYIMGLSAHRSPKVSEIAHCMRNAGVTTVHLPMELECFYLSETLDMQKFGLDYIRVPADSVLKPIENDGLKFLVDDDTQISIRTCVFYTNANLIEIEVV